MNIDSISSNLNKDINSIYSLMTKNDTAYTLLFDSVVEKTVDLEGDDSTKQKYDSVIAIEFILVRLRILISTEQVKVKSVINNKMTPVTWVPIFKQRDVLLSSYHQKLIELRDDIATLQKAVYTQNNYNFK